MKVVINLDGEQEELYKSLYKIIKFLFIASLKESSELGENLPLSEKARRDKIIYQEDFNNIIFKIGTAFMEKAIESLKITDKDIEKFKNVYLDATGKEKIPLKVDDSIKNLFKEVNESIKKSSKKKKRDGKNKRKQ